MARKKKKGRAGGQATLRKHGKAHFAKIGKKGHKAARKVWCGKSDKKSDKKKPAKKKGK